MKDNMNKSEMKRIMKGILKAIKDKDASKELKAINDLNCLAEKEISELKEQNIKDCENFNKKMKEIKEQWNKEHYQLIKAKDLIAKLYHADECFTYDEEVEQFLKESE